MSEAAFKQMIASFIRQTRPQSFRYGKPLRYPQRAIASAATSSTTPSREEQPAEWQAHRLATDDNTSRLDHLRQEPEPRSFSSFLTDTHSRQHNYLRISVTERCNLRCLYCMPEEGVALSPPSHLLTTPEIVHLSSLFVSQGVDKIRLTGGEPTVRKDIVNLMHQIGRLRAHGLQELCLTTNGISLHRKLDAMVDAGLTGVNLSLDTMDPFQFTLMTRRNGHETVMKSIDRILELNRAGAGIKLKINCVVMRGVNEREILPFVEMGQNQDLEVRFIEYMPFDGNKWSQKKMLSFQEMLAMIQEKYPNVHKQQGHANDTSKTYKIPGFKGRIGFITSMTHNFCGTCNRLRITSDGNLKVCLFGNSEVSLRDILRESNNGQPIDAEAMDAIRTLESTHQPSAIGHFGQQPYSERDLRLLDVIGAAVKRKKAKHAGMGKLENMKNRPMILIDCEPRPSRHHLPHSSSPTSSISHANTLTMNQRMKIPLHLLYPTAPASVQVRHISTRIIRTVPSQAVFRKSYGPRFRKAPEIEQPEQLNNLGPENQIHHQVRNGQAAAGEDSTSAGFSTGTAQRLTHLDDSGAARMVNIARKEVTARTATAVSTLFFSKPDPLRVLSAATLEKGDAIAVARIAAIQAAKKTPDLIPLAHPSLGLTQARVSFRSFGLETNLPIAHQESKGQESPWGITAHATVSCHGRTGVEMEALTAASVATLTLYDMLKAVDKKMVIGDAYVRSKKGGKSGSWVFDRSQSTSPNLPLDSTRHMDKDDISETLLMEEDEEEEEEEVEEEDVVVDNAVSEETKSTTPPQAITSIEEALKEEIPGESSLKHSQQPQINPSMSMRIIKLLPESQKMALVQKLLDYHEDHLRVGREKLKLQERQFDLDQQKWQLSIIDIEQEIKKGTEKILKSHGLTPNDADRDRKSPVPLHTDNRPSAAPGVVATNTHHEPPNQTNATETTDISARKIESDVDLDPNINGAADSETMIKFDRTSRDSMSGPYSGQADRQAFQTRRHERYEDWARER